MKEGYFNIRTDLNVAYTRLQNLNENVETFDPHVFRKVDEQHPELIDQANLQVFSIFALGWEAAGIFWPAEISCWYPSLGFRLLYLSN